MKQLILIIDSFNSFYRPRLVKWAELMEHNAYEQLEIKINKLINGVVIAKLYDVFDLGYIENDSYLIYCLNFLFKSFNEIAKMNLLSRRKKIIAWKNYLSFLLYRPQAIHMVNSYFFPWYYSFIKMNKIKSIITFHGGDILLRPHENYQWRNTLNSLFKECHCLHFVSNYLKEEAIKLGASPQKTKVIYPGVDLDFFQPQKLLKDDCETKPLTLLTVTRLEWEKGLINALKAIKKLIAKRYNVKYSIIGQGAAKDELIFWIHKLELNNNVNILGKQSPESVRKFLNLCDIYLQPSIYEALCVSVIEASAMEAPVIASDVGGLPEVIDHNITGLLVPPDDPQSLEEAIKFLADNKNKRIEMGKKGREKAIRQFSLEREVKEWLALYEKALQG